jgi:hypothetical protein
MYDFGRLFDFARSFTVKMRTVGGKVYTFKQYKNGAIEVIQAGTTVLKPRRYYAANSKDALAILLRTSKPGGGAGRVAGRKGSPGIIPSSEVTTDQAVNDVTTASGGTDITVQPMSPWWYAAGAAVGTGLLYVGYRALSRKRKE